MKILQKEDTKLRNQGRNIGRNQHLQTRDRSFTKSDTDNIRLPDARMQRTWNHLPAWKKQKILDKVHPRQDPGLIEEQELPDFFIEKELPNVNKEAYVPPEVLLKELKKEQAANPHVPLEAILEANTRTYTSTEALPKEELQKEAGKAQKKVKNQILSDELKLLVLDEYARMQPIKIESREDAILCEEQETIHAVERKEEQEDSTVTNRKQNGHNEKVKRHIMRRITRFAGNQYILGTEKEAEASERKQQEVFRKAGQAPHKVRKIKKAAKAITTAIGTLVSGPVGIAFLVFICVFVVFIAIFGTMQTQTAKAVNLSTEVEGYRGTVREAAGRYGMSEYVELILAVMMQESGGRGLDPMQAAEGGFNTKYPHVPNGIKDPAYSIECGVQELKVAITAAGVQGNTDLTNIRIALQGYNFGPGYINWMKRHGYVAWSFENACAFAESTGWGRRSNPNSAAGPWKYGDQYYPVHVLQYYEVSSGFWGAGGEAAQVPYEERMAYLFPNGTPASASAMSPYLTTISVPIVNENGTHTTMNLTVHQKLADEIQQVFAEMEAIGFPIKASQTAGYNWRSMVSSGSVSHHSYGVAIDVNWNDNPYISNSLTVGNSSYQPYINRFSVTPEVIQIWKNHGFYWGGDWNSSKDYMHFSYTNH